MQLQVGGVALDRPAGQAEAADPRQHTRGASQPERQLDRDLPPLTLARPRLRLQTDAGRAQAAVDHALLVGHVDGAGQHLDEPGGRARRQRLGRGVFGQRRPFRPLDGVVEKLPFALSCLPYRHQVRMTQAAQGGGLATQRPPAHLSGVVPRHDHLEKHGAIDEQLLGPEQADA